ncbi:hypothetical protein [Paenibacillus macerans]|uniref:hypothetical protein n=1 Tax=Paenibacillus macerans TaxID=44252 RepID=UPI00203D9249|nr:hypothetical protein [Paenibacillus macerans]
MRRTSPAAGRYRRRRPERGKTYNRPRREGKQHRRWPGDPELITVKTLKRLREAEVILYDRSPSRYCLPGRG